MARIRQKLEKHPFKKNLDRRIWILVHSVCALCCESVVCRTSNVQRHYETRHQSTFKTSEKKSEAIKRAISGFKKQTWYFESSSWNEE